ncbi:MAG: C-type lectin domain-containing protein [Flavobacteriaceae bacterium]
MKILNITIFFLLVFFYTGFLFGQNTYLDNFGSTSYSRNDGNSNFSSNWIEGGDDNSASSGYIRISGNRLRFHYLWGENIRRSLDLSGASSAVLSFNWETVGLDYREVLAVQVSTNGTSFTTLNTFGGSGSGNYSVDISAYISPSTTIRFLSNDYDWESGEYAYIDNFQISAVFPPVIVNNDPPVITATGNQLYCPGGSVPVVETVSITDPDDTMADLVIIQISSGYVNGEDLLTLTGSHPTITSSWSGVEGKLTLTGPTTLSAFESAISAVVYSSSASNPSGTRQFSVTVGSANYLPSTGHYYEYVDHLGITWTDANTAASSRTFFGLQGYLATLTSQEEADFSGSQALGVGWIGGSDAATEGVWRWVTGPEAGLIFWNGTAGGSSPNFAFWNSGEPNQSGDEDYAHITHPNVNPNGSWNDLSNTGAASGNYQPQGYVVEYGGMPGDPVLNITATTAMTVDNVAPTASNPASISVNCSGEIPLPDISVVTDEADNCTTNPMVAFVGDSSNGGSNPEIITRTYRITDASGNSTDVTQTITVNPFTISSDPTDQTIFAGTSANFTVSANYADSYQWQLSTDGGTVFNNIADGAEYSGTQSATLTVMTAGVDKNGYRYRVLVSKSGSSCAAVTSDPALLSVRVGTVITNRRITYRVKKN